MMEVVAVTGNPELAEVYTARFRGRDDLLAEFVDSIDPRYPRSEKACINVSTQFGCSVGCRMCDAGKVKVAGNLTAFEILEQIDYVMRKRFPTGRVDCHKLKIHFARMGEPALNPAVLAVLRVISRRYKTAALMPCVASIAPRASGWWFERLLDLKRECYPAGNFQLQFSVNSTDDEVRDWLMPVPKWNLEEIAAYGREFARIGAPHGRKVTLNFAIASGVPLDVSVVSSCFDPASFVVKITPVNPTWAAVENHIDSAISETDQARIEEIVCALRRKGFEVIVSIGAAEENAIGSNCGQSVLGFGAYGERYEDRHCPTSVAWRQHPSVVV